MNGRQIHRLLARMTDYVETRSGMASRYGEYAQRGKKGYEIEHIWADHAERHADEFAHPSEFAEYRNRIGGLLLLPKSFNASYGDLPYAEKREHYLGQNLMARSLHEQAYDHNPGFRRFIEESGLPFRVQEGRPRCEAGPLSAACRANLEPGPAGRGRRHREAATVSEVQAQRRRVARRGAGALGDKAAPEACDAEEW